MKIMIAGAQGQLGQALCEHLKGGHELLPYGHDALDLCDHTAVDALIQRKKPDFFINAAAFTAVDDAEAQPSQAFRVNRDAVETLAASCDAEGVPLLHFSTDYVFSGEQQTPYKEDDAVNPLSVYGQSKWAGECAVRDNCAQHFIVRLGWLYGRGGNNFVNTIQRLARVQQSLKIVGDQWGSPTCVDDVAKAVIKMLEAHARDVRVWGTYHFANQGVTTWYDFAKCIVDRLGLEKPVEKITSAQFAAKAERPQCSVLDTTKIQQVFQCTIPTWEAAFDTFLSTETTTA